MKIAAVLVLVAPVVAAAAGHSHHHHRHHHAKAPACTIESESQCNGQNWSTSTCCKDPSYECRRDDFGQNVMRCQKKKSLRKAHKAKEAEEVEDASQDDSADSMDDLSMIEEFSALIRKQHRKGNSHDKIWIPGLSCNDDSDCKSSQPSCTVYNNMGQICLPSELPQGYLCGENSPKWWRAGTCGSGLNCKSVGDSSQLRCSQ